MTIFFLQCRKRTSFRRPLSDYLNMNKNFVLLDKRPNAYTERILKLFLEKEIYFPRFFGWGKNFSAIYIIMVTKAICGTSCMEKESTRLMNGQRAFGFLRLHNYTIVSMR